MQTVEKIVSQLPVPSRRVTRREWRARRPHAGPGYARLRVARGRVLLQTRKWYESGRWRASDGSTPAVIADLSAQLFAVPQFGPELISNGDFANPVTTGWATNGTNQLSIVSSALRITTAGTPGFPRATRFITTEPGKLYFFSCRARRVAGTPGAEAAVYAPGTIFIKTFGSTTSATFVTISGYFVAPMTSTQIFLNIASGTSADGDAVEYDDVSLREVMLGDVGPELILNGDFAISGTWALNQPGTSTATISGGLLNLTGDGTNSASADQSFTTEVGATYTVIFSTLTNQTTISVGTSQGGGQYINFIAQTPASWGYYSFVATATTAWVRLGRQVASLATSDNVSIRKFTSRPTLRAATFSDVYALQATRGAGNPATYVDAAGVMQTITTSDVPRFDYSTGAGAVLVENQSVNFIRNGNGVGAVSGTPGTMPTYWINALGTGMSRQIVGTGVLNGIPYVDIRFFGTPTTSPTQITFDAARVTTLNGETNTSSCYLALVDGSTSGLTFVGLRQISWSAVPTALTTYIGPDLRSSLNSMFTRYVYPATITDASAATVESVLAFSGTGSPVDITVRIGALQHERNQAFASSYISTITASATRNIESFRFSPLVEAIIGMAACSIDVKGRLSNTSTTVSRALVGNDGVGTLLYANAGGSTIAGTFNSSTGILATLGGGQTFNTDNFASALSFNSSGRSVVSNNGTVATDTSQVGSKTVTYMGRSPSSSTFGDGRYTQLVIYPNRLTDAALKGRTA